MAADVAGNVVQPGLAREADAVANLRHIDQQRKRDDIQQQENQQELHQQAAALFLFAILGGCRRDLARLGGFGRQFLARVRLAFLQLGSALGQGTLARERGAFARKFALAGQSRALARQLAFTGELAFGRCLGRCFFWQLVGHVVQYFVNHIDGSVA